ncbi:MAG: hypothetical protein GHCLOJNM_03668 [bacterium]|nr:hypothetical protein [bacterium]
MDLQNGLFEVNQDDLRAEYRREDLGRGVRGKHDHAYREGTNLVLLKPEVAAVFPTEEAVNDALGSLTEVARRLGARNGGRHRVDSGVTQGIIGFHEDRDFHSGSHL